MPPRRRSRASEEAAGSGPAAPDPAWVLAGRGFVRGRLTPLEVGISEEGTIAAIGRDLRAPRRHDVGDAIILPSATDLHVHFREPGGSRDVEGFATGTVQAALGGVGLVGDMPNTDPAVRDPDGIDQKRRLLRGRAAVDVALFGMLAVGSDVAGLGRTASAFKLYLSPTSGVDEPPDHAAVADLLERAAGTGLAVSVHAEDAARFPPPGEPPTDLEGWDRARPPDAEATAVEEILRAAPPDLRLHIAHVTQPSIADRLRAAGHSFEATPHHLLLSTASRLGTEGKVNPPLRSEATRQELWDRFRSGAVPIVASDHAPHARADKSRPFATAPSGMPGAQTMVPLLLERVRAGDLPLPTLVATAAERPALWLGQPRGRIVPGFRADLIVVDFRDRRPIRGRELAGPCGWSAFEGRPAVFPREHYLGGERIVQDAEYVGVARGVLRRPDYARAA